MGPRNEGRLNQRDQLEKAGREAKREEDPAAFSMILPRDDERLKSTRRPLPSLHAGDRLGSKSPKRVFRAATLRERGRLQVIAART